MSEALHATIGRKQVELEGLNAEYDRLLTILARVASGDILPDRVSVDLQSRTWAVAATHDVPPETAGVSTVDSPTIN